METLLFPGSVPVALRGLWIFLERAFKVIEKAQARSRETEWHRGAMSHAKGSVI